MSSNENQGQATPIKVNTRAPMLIEVPVNTQPSPTSASKAKQRLAGYPSPRKQCTLDGLNERLQGAEERRNNKMNDNRNKEKMERVQKKQEELENTKKQAADARAARIANAEANRENLHNERVKKASEHVTRAKEVSSSIKKAEQSEYQSKREEMEKTQKAAAARAALVLEQKKQSAANHHEKIQDSLAQKGCELRVKKAALDQKMKDAEARRNVVEVSKCMKATKATAVVTSRAKIVIDVPLEKSFDGDGSKAKQRLEANKTTSTSELSKDDVDVKLKQAGERREQYLNQRLLSPTQKTNTEKFLQNREQLECKKKESAEAQAKRVADAEAKAKLLNEAKAKKAGEHCTKVKETMQSHALAEANQIKTKKESMETKQQAAEARHQAQIQQKKESAQALAIKIGENVKEQDNKLKEKRVAIDQKLKDAEARRNVVEAYKASPAKLTKRPSSPKKPPAAPTFGQ